ncbi:DUF4214 domain-containing protein [Methylobacterium sp. WL12]|uniref:DUF4214 domain-containing protein n=1 Tax=Methylobacterium sp. WL12 TaxID=2603890 RepID=UPI0011C74731|nr:DUF4214 domain-containing protein [Methylobacterium sp. WL12]TXM66790.1 DUF4214 domain-containing protein [Methylobacterium sp. WL12]
MAAVSDYRALLSGASWYQQDLAGKPVILTYSFDQISPSYYAQQYAGAVGSFAALNNTEKDVVRSALQQWSAISGVQFVETTKHEGDITFSFYNLDAMGFSNAAGLATPPTGFAYSSSGQTGTYSGDYLLSGDVWFDSSLKNATNTDFLSHVALHEIGHALGLKHPHDIDPSHPYTLTSETDTGSNTVMSYKSPSATHLGPMDVAVAQYIYGSADVKGTQFSSWGFDAAAERLVAHGTAAGELLRGTGADDVIYSEGGKDIIATSQGNDTIVAQGQSLDINGGSGVDTVITGLTLTSPDQLGGSGNFRYMSASGGNQTYIDIERFVFTNDTIAVDVQGNAGQVYRLYQAAFARTPDKAGLSHNVHLVDQGISLHDMAAAFTVSAESQTRYGANPSDSTFITALYANVLGRAPDPTGNAGWLQLLGSHQYDRAGVLIGFSESPENHAKVDPSIAAGIHLDYGAFA